MRRKETPGIVELDNDTWNGAVWNTSRVQEYVEKLGKCVVLIDGFAVDVTSYLGDHVRLVTFDLKFWWLIVFAAWRSKPIAKIFIQIGNGCK